MTKNTTFIDSYLEPNSNPLHNSPQRETYIKDSSRLAAAHATFHGFQALMLPEHRCWAPPHLHLRTTKAPCCWGQGPAARQCYGMAGCKNSSSVPLKLLSPKPRSWEAARSGGKKKKKEISFSWELLMFCRLFPLLVGSGEVRIS